MGEERPEITNHGIQLNYVGVREIKFVSNRLPSTLKPEDFPETGFSFGTGPYDANAKTISVLVKAEVKSKDEEVQVLVELISEFRVDEELFPAEKIEHWAKNASFYVLFPFLREHLYAICTRVGMPGIILPLIHIPAYRSELGSEKQTEPATAPELVN